MRRQSRRRRRSSRKCKRVTEVSLRVMVTTSKTKMIKRLAMRRRILRLRSRERLQLQRRHRQWRRQSLSLRSRSRWPTPLRPFLSQNSWNALRQLLMGCLSPLARNIVRESSRSSLMSTRMEMVCSMRRSISISSSRILTFGRSNSVSPPTSPSTSSKNATRSRTVSTPPTTA